MTTLSLPLELLSVLLRTLLDPDTEDNARVLELLEATRSVRTDVPVAFAEVFVPVDVGTMGAVVVGLVVAVLVSSPPSGW